MDIGARPSELTHRIHRHGVRLARCATYTGCGPAAVGEAEDENLLIREVLLHRRAPADPGVAVERGAGLLVLAGGRVIAASQGRPSILPSTDESI